MQVHASAKIYFEYIITSFHLVSFWSLEFVFASQSWIKCFHATGNSEISLCQLVLQEVNLAASVALVDHFSHWRQCLDVFGTLKLLQLQQACNKWWLAWWSVSRRDRKECRLSIPDSDDIDIARLMWFHPLQLHFIQIEQLASFSIAT